MKKELEKIKIIEIKGERFTLDITKLTVNDFLSIEVEKQMLTLNQYGKLATTFFQDSTNAANLIDMIATFRVLNADIEKCVATKLFLTMNLFDTRELLKVYKKEVSPWYREWMKEFNDPFEDIEEGGSDLVDDNEK